MELSIFSRYPSQFDCHQCDLIRDRRNLFEISENFFLQDIIKDLKSKISKYKIFASLIPTFFRLLRIDSKKNRKSIGNFKIRAYKNIVPLGSTNFTILPNF